MKTGTSSDVIQVVIVTRRTFKYLYQTLQSAANLAAVAAIQDVLRFYIAALIQGVLKYYIRALIQGVFKYYIAALMRGVFEILYNSSNTGCI